MQLPSACTAVPGMVADLATEKPDVVAPWPLQWLCQRHKQLRGPWMNA